MSNEYFPAAWVLVDYGIDKGADRYAIVAGWRGGYLHGDSWRRSSPVTSAKTVEDGWIVETSSGSSYILSEKLIGVTMVTQSVIAQMPVTVIDDAFEIGGVFHSLKGENNE